MKAVEVIETRDGEEGTTMMRVAGIGMQVIGTIQIMIGIWI